MEKIVEQALLYDFYGELLTPHQQSIYEDAVYHDLSLGEIAQEQGISRQGVHDLLKRCDKILQDYESKLHLVEKFTAGREKIREIIALTKEIEQTALNREQDITIDISYGQLQNTIARVRVLSEDLMKEW